MAVQHIPFTRGGIDYIEHIGTENGQSVHYIEETINNPRTEQPDIWIPLETVIKRKGRGAVGSILTIFEKVSVGANGDLVRYTDSVDPIKRWYTNDQDIAFFIGGFGMPIMMSETNLFVRRGLGFNDKPLWNPATGAVLQYTPEQEAEPPTNDYWPTPQSIA